jgi:hypothetical protein
MGTELALEAPSEVVVETPPLRLEEPREVDWRLRPAAPGRFNLMLKAGGRTYLKSIVVDGRRLEKVSPIKVSQNFLDQLLYPGEKALPGGSPVESIAISHPVGKLGLFGLRVHWLIAYFGLSIIFGFALKKPFRVEI